MTLRLSIDYSRKECPGCELQTYKHRICLHELHQMEGCSSEASLMNVEVMVVYPGEYEEKRLFVTPANLVKEEKQKLLRHIEIYDPEDFVLVLIGPNKLQTVLDDSENLETYLEDMASSAESYLEIRRKNAAFTVKQRPVDTQLMNIALK
ncbi:hypothetical protein BgiBS90_019347 [Biomphalaria glabrata]|uniref:Uncharacterized protein n=1 Tax=Biomphalaria glabrata TaxID=6526 RepID=A0A2C9KL69_BIOGL|nr:hypothetical protein BgiBS90_019347 [Biomphalaria glabrata]